ncbi:L-galactose dehydrogenase [Gracilaria domingensis]|nr:L-galactose dehydrogenase [Gracilaria domingensis]
MQISPPPRAPSPQNPPRHHHGGLRPPRRRHPRPPSDRYHRHLRLPLGFGAATLGNIYGEINEQDGIDAVLEAVKQGVNYFDTSPYYGKTKAELVLGKALRQLPRDSFVVSTKVGRYDFDAFDFSPDRVTRSVEQSMSRLGLQFIDIILCHDIEFEDLDVIVHQTIPALLQLKEAGKVRAIGITGYPLEIFTYVLSAVPPGTIDLVLTYCNYCLQNDRLSDILSALRKANITVICASPLSMGLLTSRGPPPWHPADAQIKSIAKSAAEYCEKRGADLPTLALQFALQADHDVVASTLVGIDSVDTLHKNLRIIKQPPDEALLKEVRALFDPVRNRRWSSGRFLGSSAS